MTEIGKFNFNYNWKFKLADAFPLKDALTKLMDCERRFFYERGYAEKNWELVGVPHTYNDSDLFVQRIEDAGSNQKRTFAFYRKWLDPIGNLSDKKVFLEVEGIRQTCFLYVNGKMAGYIESGVAPFGFDITPYLEDDRENLIAIATDSTSTRNLDFYSAETVPEEEPGSFYTSQNMIDRIPEEKRGIGYFWNCNDFNPCVGGLTSNIWLHVKSKIYITLPLYSNLMTKGIYVYGSDYNINDRTAKINVEAEICNESDSEKEVYIRSSLFDDLGAKLAEFDSEKVICGKFTGYGGGLPPITVIPSNAYKKVLIDKTSRTYKYEQANESEYGETCKFSPDNAIAAVRGQVENLCLWQIEAPYLYTVKTELICDGKVTDSVSLITGFRKVAYEGKGRGFLLNDVQVWLTGYAQRAANEWAAIGCAVDWLKDYDARLIKESNANHIRFMHIAGRPADIRSFDRYGVVCTQPAGDKERENFGRQWKQRVEAMRDVIIYFRNNPSIIFWEAGNNSINKEHMREMRELKEFLDPNGGRFMGCRTINTEDVIAESEYVGTMLNRHAARFQSEMMPVTETEYFREEAPRRVWDDYSPPDYDYDNLWLGRGGRKQIGGDCHDLNAEEFALCAARSYAEFFHDRMGGGSFKNLYSAAAALCWTDSAQHGRQAYSENGRMSGRVDPVRIKKQNFRVFQLLQSAKPDVHIIGHFSYPKEGEDRYRYPVKEFDGTHYKKTGEYAYRNPKDKTVYVLGSYAIAKVKMYINGRYIGMCDKPKNTFIFEFPHINVTENGEIYAEAYDFKDNVVAKDKIITINEPKKLKLSLNTGNDGLWADGTDIAYIDVEVIDHDGRICPLCERRIDFEVSGEAVFLGGYNSGRFNGYGRNDSVIHQNHVYAECGVNRVFLRSTRNAGEIRVKAYMSEQDNIMQEEISFNSIQKEVGGLVKFEPKILKPKHANEAINVKYGFNRIPEADALKYTPDTKLLCKVLVNGQEPDTRSTLSVVDHGSVYSPVLYILGYLKGMNICAFDFVYEDGSLVITSSEYNINAKTGRTYLLVNGNENLMSGQPYIDGNGEFIMEINAIISYIKGVKAWYDDKVNVFRIEY